MKTLTCKDLGGPCDAPLTGNTFEEIGAASKTHVMEQIGKGDVAHKKAVERWMNLSEEERGDNMKVFQRLFDEVK